MHLFIPVDSTVLGETVLHIFGCLSQYCPSRPDQCVGNIINSEYVSFLNFFCTYSKEMGQKEFIISTSLAFFYFYRHQYENLAQGNLHFNI